jgi:ABC-type branched-subunit amino acid transport system ATPase component
VPSEQTSSPALTMQAVTKRFGGVVAVSEASIVIKGGEVHGLIGPNGAGKSTTIGLITGFIRPTSGSIRYGDADLSKQAPHAIVRKGVSRTFQQAAPLVGLSVVENVMAGFHTSFRSNFFETALTLPRARREQREAFSKARELLELVGLADQANMEAKELTFGKLRFLEIARALAMEPKILLLDEPAAGLNELETERLASLIRDRRSTGMGFLLVDHDVNFVFGLSDRVTVMNFGSVIANGTPAEVNAMPIVREAYLGGAPQGVH